MDNDPPRVETRWRSILFLHAALFALVLWVFLSAVDNDFVGFDEPGLRHRQRAAEAPANLEALNASTTNR